MLGSDSHRNIGRVTPKKQRFLCRSYFPYLFQRVAVLSTQSPPAAPASSSPPSLVVLPAKLGGCALRLQRILVDFARRDLHESNGIADYVSGMLLAF
jgi:hypothetical protein